MLVKPVAAEDIDALERFLRALPKQDGGFLKADMENLVDRNALLDRERGARLIALDDDDVTVGFAAVLPSVGRSSHVAELRLIVAAGVRRQGIGRRLARAALLSALSLGLEKLAVEVLAQQDDLVDMFMDLGFEAEALLHDFVRDEDGRYADLIVLVHPATAAAADYFAAGIAESIQ